MPLNCPLPFGLTWQCHECRYYYDSVCRAIRPPTPLRDILTPDERIDALERGLLPQPEWTGKQWDAVEQVKAEVNYLLLNLNEHIDASRKQAELTKKDSI